MMMMMIDDDDDDTNNNNNNNNKNNNKFIRPKNQTCYATYTMKRKAKIITTLIDR